MKNLQIIKEKMSRETIVNVAMIENMNDIERFIAEKNDVILNSTTVMNNIVNKYKKPTVLRFKFENKETAAKWLEANKEDYIKILRTCPRKVLLVIQY